MAPTAQRPAAPWRQFVAGPLLALVAVGLCLAMGGCQQDPGAAVAGHLAAATELEAAGKPDAALAELQAAVALRPDDPELHRRRGELLLATGDGALAAVELNKAIALGTPRGDLLPGLAESLLLQKRPLEALALLATAGPEPASAEVALGLASVRARSQLANRNASANHRQAALLAAFAAIDRARAGSGAAGRRAEAEAARFAALRATTPAVARAADHHACRTATPQRFAAGMAAGPPAAAPAGRVLRVGPGQNLPTPAAAARAARDGDTVEITPGTYPAGNALWIQDDLTVRGVPGGGGERPRILAGARGIEGRDVWLFTGDRVRIENLEISGARAATSRNGAAIRHMGRDLVLRNVYLHDNENGLLTGNREPDSEILIEHSEFAGNGYGDGQSHNIYVGSAGSLTLRFSWSHDSRSGHLVKSRARRNLILANRLTDGDEGRSSFEIDLSEGGMAVIAGNVLHKSHAGENPAFIIYAAEGTPYAENSLTVAHNTFWNGRFKAIGIRNRSRAPATVINNIFAGAPLLALDGPGELTANLRRAETGLADPRRGNYAPLAGSAAIDAGVAPGGLPLPDPLLEYVHPLAGRERLKVWTPDLGAYEYCGG